MKSLFCDISNQWGIVSLVSDCITCLVSPWFIASFSSFSCHPSLHKLSVKERWKKIIFEKLLSVKEEKRKIKDRTARQFLNDYYMFCPVTGLLFFFFFSFQCQTKREIIKKKKKKMFEKIQKQPKKNYKKKKTTKNIFKKKWWQKKYRMAVCMYRKKKRKKNITQQLNHLRIDKNRKWKKKKKYKLYPFYDLIKHFLREKQQNVKLTKQKNKNRKGIFVESGEQFFFFFFFFLIFFPEPPHPSLTFFSYSPPPHSSHPNLHPKQLHHGHHITQLFLDRTEKGNICH